jgi:hypothetical protein
VEFFGKAVSLVTLLQVAVTLVLVAIYVTKTSFNEQRSTHLSDLQMLLASAFVISNHPSRKSPQDLLESKDDDLKKTGSDLRIYADRLRKYQADGTIPTIAQAPRASLREHVLAIALAPIFAAAVVVVATEELRNKTFLICHTDYRKDFIGKASLIAIVNVFAGAAVAHFSPAITATPWLVATAVPLLGAVLSCAGIAVLIYQQQSWKAFWNDRMLELMAVGEHSANHDLFNRAFAYLSHVEAQPDIPLPGRLGLYTGLFTAVQGIILLAQRWLNLA